MREQLSFFDLICGACGHLKSVHSREHGVGCLHQGGNRRTDCDCTLPGDSEADQ